MAGSIDRGRERGRRPAAVAPLRDCSHRRGRGDRGDRLASRLGLTERRPGHIALAGAAAKVAAATVVVGAFGIDHPLRAALVLVPAVELAAVLPITPGNVGLASAAVALALGSQGVDSKTALSAGIAFGAVELLTGVVIGAAGALGLAGPSARPYLRLATVAAAASVVAVAFGATVLLPAV